MKQHAIVVVALSLAGVAPAQEVVKIGHVAAVTGPVAYFGKDTENGARLAIEALNGRGVVIGGKKVRFELVAEDDAGEPRQATTVAQKLADAKVNGVVGHQTSARPSRPRRSITPRGSRRFRTRVPVRSTPGRASTRRSAWWPMTRNWAARSDVMR